MGAVTVVIAVLALAWNVVFNGLFDRVHWRGSPSAAQRLGPCMHALLFEGGLIVMGVPLIAWWLSVSLWQAFLLDIGVLLFFLPYTYVYHWGYDVVREQGAVDPGGLLRCEEGSKLPSPQGCAGSDFINIPPDASIRCPLIHWLPGADQQRQSQRRSRQAEPRRDPAPCCRHHLVQLGIITHGAATEIGFDRPGARIFTLMLRAPSSLAW